MEYTHGAIKDISDDPWRLIKAYVFEVQRLIDKLVKSMEDFAVGHDDQVVHEIRTTLRRIEASVDFLQPFASKDHCIKAKDQIKGLIKRSNRFRDYQVELLYLKPYKRDYKEIYESAKRAFIEEKKRLKDYMADMHPQRYVHKIERCFAFLVKDFIYNYDRTAIDLQTAYRDEMMAVFSELDKINDADDKALHEIRLKVKALRYKAELLEALIGETLPETEKLKEFQDILGKYHDLNVLQKRLFQRFAPDKVSGLLDAIRNKYAGGI
jgi:CHAD domain-containing protein